jgi:uncharacterized protein
MDNMSFSLSNAVNRQKPEINRILELAFVSRDVAYKLIRSLDDEAVKVITGPRRSGKSCLAVQALAGRNFAYFNFEDESLNFDYSSDDLIAALSTVYPNFQYILFDEIQLCPRWEHLVNRLHRLGHKLIITGSNSKLLSGELASSLTGRCLEFKLFTFSYEEFLLARNLPKTPKSFVDYLQTGGFPSVATERSKGADFLPTLWDAVILKDLVQRFNIRRSVELKNLLHVVLLNMCSRVSARSLSRNLKDQLTHSTISKYLSWSENAYLCSLLHEYSFKPRERVNSDKKIYLYDTGFFTAHQRSGAGDLGRLLENYVFAAICRSGLTPNLDFFTYRTKAKYVVDFYIASNTHGRKLIQACYDTTDFETQKRELRALAHAARELNVTEAIVVTCAEGGQTYQYDGLEVNSVPAWDFKL